MHELGLITPPLHEHDLSWLRRRPVAATPAPVGKAAAVPATAPDFETAWSLHSGRVFSRCLALMAGRRDDAEEAFSRSALAAFQRYPAHRPRIRNAGHWLLRLARNVCIDLHRERARAARRAGPELTELSELPQTPGPGSDPEATLLQDEVRGVVRAAMSKLPPRLRRPLLLRVSAGWRDREIARRLGLTEVTVRKRLQAARAALRAELAAYVGAGAGPEIHVEASTLVS